MIKEEFINNFEHVIVQPLVPGRVVRVTLFSPSIVLNIVHLHIEPMLNDSANKELWNKMHATAEEVNVLTFVIGDFSLVEESEGRFNPRTNEVTFGDKSNARWLGQRFDDFIELAQEDFTHRVIKDDEVHILSRIDRCLCNMLALDMNDSKASGGVWGNPFVKDELSDHVPVSFRLEPPRLTPPITPSIPPWLVATETHMDEFPLLKERHTKDMDQISRWDAVECIKQLAHTAASKAKAQIRAIVAASLDEMTHCATSWLRARR